MLLKYHIRRFLIDLLCVRVRVRFGWGGIRAAGRSTTSCASAGSPDTKFKHSSRTAQ